MTLLKLHSEPVQEAWLDAYGHLNEAYYLVPFTNATWKWQEHFEIGVPYFESTGCAIYTVETHLRYLKEVRAPAIVEVETMVLGSDPKRLWYAHQMVIDGDVHATAEFMALHYDTRQAKTAVIPEAVQTALKRNEITEKPQWVGRSISL